MTIALGGTRDSTFQGRQQRVRWNGNGNDIVDVFPETKFWIVDIRQPQQYDESFVGFVSFDSVPAVCVYVSTNKQGTQHSTQTKSQKDKPTEMIQIWQRPLAPPYRRIVSSCFSVWTPFSSDRSSLPPPSVTTQRHEECKFLRGIHPHHLWQVIQNVDAYSEFLPLCHDSQILRRQGKEWMDATLTVGIPPFLMETFVSRVHIITMDNNNNNNNHHEPNQQQYDYKHGSSSLSSGTKLGSETLIVEATSIQSQVLENLSSRWELQARMVEDEIGTLVHFWMEMSVRDPVIVAGLNHMLKEVAGRQVAAFEQRCRSIPWKSNS
jgi:ribosome-associated toxin RatA of RatAB toxin-antitoxin module